MSRKAPHRSGDSLDDDFVFDDIIPIETDSHDIDEMPISTIEESDDEKDSKSMKVEENDTKSSSKEASKSSSKSASKSASEPPQKMGKNQRKKALKRKLAEEAAAKEAEEAAKIKLKENIDNRSKKKQKTKSTPTEETKKEETDIVGCDTAFEALDLSDIKSCSKLFWSKYDEVYKDLTDIEKDLQGREIGQGFLEIRKGQGHGGSTLDLSHNSKTLPKLLLNALGPTKGKFSKTFIKTANKSPGSPTIIILCPSAIRTLDLLKSMKSDTFFGSFPKDRRIIALFSKHKKIDEHVQLLKSQTTPIIIATPARLAALLEHSSSPLSLAQTKHIWIDTYRLPGKNWSIFDFRDIKTQLMKLFKSHLEDPIVHDKKISLSLF